MFLAEEGGDVLEEFQVAFYRDGGLVFSRWLGYLFFYY